MKARVWQSPHSGSVAVLRWTMAARVVALVSLALTAWLIAGSVAFAKGPFDKITLAGPGLADPIEITDPRSLEPINIWTRSFVDWGRDLVAEPPPVERTYTVAFYLDSMGRAYVLRYHLDPSGDGYLYFADRGEPDYELNIGAITSGDSDAWDPNGKWHYATQRWLLVVQRALERNGTMPNLDSLDSKPESTGGGRRVSVLRRQEGAPVLLG